MNHHAVPPESREAQFGLRVGGLLSSSLSQLQGDVTERLRFARTQALARARQQHVASATMFMGVQGASLALGRGAGPWQRAASALPLLLLLAGLWWVQLASQREQALAVASVDAVLLADTLPLQAYSDPGFAEYLRSGPP